MGNLFGGAKLPPAQQTPAGTGTAVAPSVNAPLVAKPSQSYVAALSQAMGRGSTILTSGQGDTSAPNVQRKQLSGSLGG
jgi:hypothetical protein